MRKITRREVLASTVAIGAAGLAGCVSGDDDGSGNGDDTGSGNGDDTGSGNGDDTGSENGDDTGSENGDDTGSENGDDTGSENGDGNGDQNASDGTGDSDSENGPEVSIETRAAECGSADDETADVEFGADVITVTGTTPAPNPCHEAHVESVTVEEESFSLAVNVREDIGDGEGCGDCLGRIEYEAQIRPEDTSNITRGTVEHVQGGTYGVGISRGGDGAGSSGVTDASIRTTEAGCHSGSGGDEVTLARESGGFTVDGEISVPTPCHEATLGPVELDGGRLTVDVGLESTSQICQECLGLIEYEASIELADPDSVDTVVVTHPEERYTLDPANAE